METKDYLDIYKTLFETWRFEVNSHWQRSSYFAAFETVAIAACWRLLDDTSFVWAGVMLSLLGIALTEIWRRNNNKTHFYALYWLGRVADLERTISKHCAEEIDFATAILNRPRTDRIRHRDLVQAVTKLFFIAWVTLLLLGLMKASTFRLPPIVIQRLGGTLTYEMTTLLVSMASLLLGVAAVWIARSSLSQARKFAEQEQRDWRQRKWFDLYFKADEAYDALDHFQVLYPNSSLPEWGSPKWQQDWSDLMRAMRTVNRMAVVFPKSPVIDEVFASTAVFASQDEALSQDRLQQLLNAVEGIRQKSLVDPTVLQ